MGDRKAGDALEYLSYCPGPPLDCFVENLWSLSDAPPHARERILPSGTLELGYLGSLMVSKAPHVLLEARKRLPPGSASVTCT